MCVNCLGIIPSDHTLLHKEVPSETPSPLPPSDEAEVNSVTSHTATGLETGSLLMTFRVIVHSLMVLPLMHGRSSIVLYLHHSSQNV